MNVRPANLERVAALPQPDWDALWYAIDLLVAGRIREPDFPPDLHARLWRLMRHCGANVRSFDTMRLIASSLAYNRLTIERLRYW